MRLECLSDLFFTKDLFLLFVLKSISSQCSLRFLRDSYIWHTYLRRVSQILNPADRNALPFSPLSGGSLAQKVMWCRTPVQERPHWPRLPFQDLHKHGGVWNVIPGLVHSTDLAVSKFCLCLSFSGSLSNSCCQCLWNPRSPPPVAGQAACFHNCVLKTASSYPYALFPEESSQTMRRREDLLGLWCCFGYRDCWVLNQIHLDLPWMKCWYEPN